MPQTEAGHHAAGQGIEDRRPFPGEVRQHQEAVGAGRVAPPPRRASRTARRRQLLEPGGQAAGRGHAGRQRVLPRSTPAVVQSIGCAPVLGEDLHEEHRRAVHEHQVTGWRTPALKASAHASTVPATTGFPTGSPVSRGRSVTRPRPRRATPGGAAPGRPHVRRPVGRPRRSWRVVQRVALAGRVVVEYVLAGKAGGDEGVRAVPAAAAFPDVSGSWCRTHSILGPRPGWTAPSRPLEDLVAHRTASSAPRSRPWRASRCRTGWRAERPQVGVAEHQARAQSADAHAGHCRPPASVELPGDRARRHPTTQSPRPSRPSPVAAWTSRGAGQR